jgi:hypothetical protein
MISSLPADGSNRVLASSRRRRFTRFRSTMFLPYFGTITPMRGRNKREGVARASRCSVCTRFPVRLTSSRSASLVSRWLRGKPIDLRAGVFRRQLHSEPLPTFFASTAKYFTSPFSRHTQSEPVGSNAALISGTVRGLTHYTTPETRKIEFGIEAGKTSPGLKIGQAR